MEADKYNPKQFYLNEIYISELVFDKGNGLSLLGFLKDIKTNEFERWDFFSDFNQLTDILLVCGEEGEKLIEILAKSILDIVEIPTVIDIEKQIDTILKVDGFIFKVYFPHEKDKEGNWKPTNDNCLFIDAIEPKEKYASKNVSTFISFLKNGFLISDDLDNAISNIVVDESQEELDNLLIVLNKSYLVYKGLIAQKFKEKKARLMAGLKDDFLFKIAELNNRIYGN